MQLRFATAVLLSTFVLAHDALAQEIYVPDYVDATVSVVSGATNSVVAAIPLAGSPQAVVVSPDGAYAYVALDAGTTVAVIDTATHSVVHEIPVSLRADPTIHIGTGPTADRLFVTSWVATFGCPTAPDGEAYDIARSISVIDISDPLTATEIELLPVDQGVFPFAIDPGGQYAYAVGCAPVWDVLHKIDLTVDPDVDDPVVASLNLSQIFATDVRVSPDPLKPFALVSASTCVLVIDLITFTEEIGAGDCSLVTPWGIEFNDAGSRAWIADYGGGLLHTFDIAVDTSNPLDLGVALTLVSQVAVNSGVGGTPTEVSRSGSTLYMTTTPEYWVAAADVVSFDISGDTPVQGCGLPVGNGGFQLDVAGEGTWLCPDIPPPPPDDKWEGKGAGHLSGAPRVQFEFHAKWTKYGPKGQCNVQDDTAKKGRKIRCLDVTELFKSGDELVVRGNALDGKTPTTYEIRATDYSKPNEKVSADTFAITTASGFSAGAETLRRGDNRIKPVKEHASDDDDEDDD